MKYVIITDSDTTTLSKRVTEHLNEGYELVGGLVINAAGRYCQAMVKI
jgi:hypothetical protein